MREADSSSNGQARHHSFGHDLTGQDWTLNLDNRIADVQDAHQK